MKGTSRLIIPALLAVFAGAAQAAEPYALRPYFNVGPTITFADDDNRQSDNGAGYYAGFGIPLHRYFGLEANIYQSWFDRDNAPNNLEWDERAAEVNALFTYPLASGIVPYVSVGAGMVRSELDGAGHSNDPAYSYGAGMFSYGKIGSQDVGVRFDIRFRQLDVDAGDIGGGFASDKFEELVLRLGAVIPFGPALSYGDAKPAPVAKAADSDGDGVADSIDQCPDTPKGTKVGADGCPIAVVVAGDRSSLQKFETIYFAFDKSDITAESSKKLDQIVAKLNELQGQRPVIRLELAGHTDDIGSTGYNQALSERRAIAVRNYLVSKGVGAKVIDTQAYGEVRPAASNATEAQRALNRRVEVEAFSD